MSESNSNPDRMLAMELEREIQQFLFDEADAVDSRQFERWLEFFAEDLRYWIPLRKNMPGKGKHPDVGGDRDAAWIDDDMETLRKRVAQILTGVHWAEEPPSRVVHLVTNIRVKPIQDSADHHVFSNLIVHRNRLETESDLIVARREDKIRRAGGLLKIYRRTIYLNHHTLTAKNLSFFV